MGRVMRRPDPYEVFVKDREQQVDVLGVPRAGLAVDDLLDLSFDGYFATSMARLSRMTMTFT
jgi:hypothetical protein